MTADPQDRRQVVAQAWYPTDVTEGQRVPYFEAQDRLPAVIGLYPSWSTILGALHGLLQRAAEVSR